MKKIIVLLWCIPFLLTSSALFSNTSDMNQRFSTAFTAGYVFKFDDCQFKDVYGHGMVNAITADGCYYPWDIWGFGAKLSYWRAKGKTTFLKQRSIVQELPFTLYVRAMKTFACKLQLYASFGGGVIWTKEKNYLGHVRFCKGIGEIEAGLNYPLWRCINITSAFRYLFPPQSHEGEKVNVGGFDMRAGVGFSF